MNKTTLPVVFITLALSLLIGGCGLLGAEESADEPIRLLADHSTYQPGDAVTLTLINDSSHEIGYNLCFSTLERNTSAGWEELGTVGQGVCPAVQYNLSPDSEASYEDSLPADLQDGEYRVSTKVHWETGDDGRGESRSRELRTDTFLIRGP